MSNTFLISAPFLFIATYILIFNQKPDQVIRCQARNFRDRSGIRSRLEELGKVKERDYEDFRTHQIIYILTTFLGTVVFIGGILGRNVLFSFFLGVFISSTVYVLIDRNLTKQVDDQRQKIDAEFPAVIEMLTLSLSAGETPLTSISRIAQKADGYLAKSLKIVVSEVRQGVPFHVALDSMGRRVNSILVRRFVDALIIAMLRGAPLIDVLQRHAFEARGAQRNRVLSAASRAEISMMIPVVFLILPISILFALWPSVTNLNLFAS